MIRLVKLTADECRITLDTLEDCQAFGELLARYLPKSLPCTVGLVGTLGAGKTQLVKFIAQALGADPEDVVSPTFVLMHPIGTNPEIHHIDAYRIQDSDEFLELGIEELFEQPVVTIIEWADRFIECMPVNTLWIELVTQDPLSEQRTAMLTNLNRLPQWQEFLAHSLGDPRGDRPENPT
jgi:tRNA threonylcarbamoyladenosine biosynthesis protein TsaE